jgi:hypothetical protein
MFATCPTSRFAFSDPEALKLLKKRSAASTPVIGEVSVMLGLKGTEFNCVVPEPLSSCAVKCLRHRSWRVEADGV